MEEKTVVTSEISITIKVIGGKWKTLTNQLRELEDDGIIRQPAGL